MWSLTRRVAISDADRLERSRGDDGRVDGERVKGSRVEGPAFKLDTDVSTRRCPDLTPARRPRRASAGVGRLADTLYTETAAVRVPNASARDVRAEHRRAARSRERRHVRGRSSSSRRPCSGRGRFGFRFFSVFFFRRFPPFPPPPPNAGRYGKRRFHTRPATVRRTPTARNSPTIAALRPSNTIITTIIVVTTITTIITMARERVLLRRLSAGRDRSSAPPR